MTGRDDERDLLALADGQLDDDPAFKATLEARLRRDPQLWARARAYAAQNAALRAAYDGRLGDPVPPRLLDALEPKPRPIARGALRAATVALALMVVGTGGWMLGERSGPDRTMETLLSRSFAYFAAERTREREPLAIEAAVSEGRPLGWLRNEVEIRIRVPDLSALGFALVDKRAIRFGPDDQVVRLDYAAADGTAFSLFLAPRWDNRPDTIVETERDGVSSAHWVEGPLATTVLSRLPPAETRRIAEMARRAMADGAVGAPTVEPGPTRQTPGGEGIIAGATVSSETAVPLPAGQLVAPQVTAN